MVVPVVYSGASSSTSTSISSFFTRNNSNGNNGNSNSNDNNGGTSNSNGFRINMRNISGMTRGILNTAQTVQQAGHRIFQWLVPKPARNTGIPELPMLPSRQSDTPVLIYNKEYQDQEYQECTVRLKPKTKTKAVPHVTFEDANSSNTNVTNTNANNTNANITNTHTNTYGNNSNIDVVREYSSNYSDEYIYT